MSAGILSLEQLSRVTLSKMHEINLQDKEIQTIITNYSFKNYLGTKNKNLPNSMDYILDVPRVTRLSASQKDILNIIFDGFISIEDALNHYLPFLNDSSSATIREENLATKIIQGDTPLLVTPIDFFKLVKMDWTSVFELSEFKEKPEFSDEVNRIENFLEKHKEIISMHNKYRYSN